jgi:hypothetical protein
VTRFSRRDLRLLYTLLGGSRDPEVPRLQDLLRHMVAERAGEQEWGAKVFELRLPLSERRMKTKGKRVGQEFVHKIAPTMNEYAGMEPFQRAALRKELDLRILAELAKWPHARLGGDVRRRGVRATRASTQILDELTVDVIGGKAPIDRLVQAGVLAGDTRELLARDAVWVVAPPGSGYFLVEVYELLPAGQSSVDSQSR